MTTDKSIYPKGKSETAHRRRTYNTMTQRKKRKGQIMIYKKTTQKIYDSVTQTPLKTGENSCDSEG